MFIWIQIKLDELCGKEEFHKMPTPEEILDNDDQYMAQARKHVDELLSKNQYTKENPLYDGNYFLSYKNYLQTIAKTITTAQGINLEATQTALKLMNPGVIGTGKLWNPLSPFGPPPGAGGYLTDLLDVPVASGNPGTEFVLRADKVKQIERKLQQQKNDELNLYTADSPMTENFYYDPAEPDLSLDNAKVVEVVPGINYPIPDISKMFDQKNTGPDFGNGEKGYNFWKTKKERLKSLTSAQRIARKALENDDAIFHKDEFDNGYITITEDQLPDGVGDDQNYMPLNLRDA